MEISKNYGNGALLYRCSLRGVPLELKIAMIDGDATRVAKVPIVL